MTVTLAPELRSKPLSIKKWTLGRVSQIAVLLLDRRVTGLTRFVIIGWTIGGLGKWQSKAVITAEAFSVGLTDGLV